MKMKQLILLTLGLVFSFTLKAQKTDTFLTSKLIPGFPKEIELIKNQMNLSDTTLSYLETGIDTMDVIFGEFTKNEKKGYWISLFSNNNFLTFTTPQLLKNTDSEFPSNTIDIKYNNSSKKIRVQITHNTKTNEIQYIWLNNNQKSKIATIQNIDKPIEKDKHFPKIKVESLIGDSISINDFIDKYVVINWWAVGCGPCRHEIPGLNKLVDKYKPNSDVVFIAIAFDKKERLEKYLELNEFKYTQTVGNKETAKLFGELFPKNIIVNPQGMITYYSEGGSKTKYMDIDEELKKQIKEE